MSGITLSSVCPSLGSSPRAGSRVARQRLHVRHELPALAVPQRRGDTYLDPELVALVRLAFADALHLGSMQRVDLPAPLAPALVLDAPGQRQRQGEDLGEIKPVGDLAGDVAHQSSEHRADALQGPVRPLELPRVRVALVLDQRALANPRIGLAQSHPM